MLLRYYKKVDIASVGQRQQQFVPTPTIHRQEITVFRKKRMEFAFRRLRRYWGQHCSCCCVFTPIQHTVHAYDSRHSYLIMVNWTRESNKCLNMRHTHKHTTLPRLFDQQPFSVCSSWREGAISHRKRTNKVETNKKKRLNKSSSSYVGTLGK